MFKQFAFLSQNTPSLLPKSSKPFLLYNHTSPFNLIHSVMKMTPAAFRSFANLSLTMLLFQLVITSQAIQFSVSWSQTNGTVSRISNVDNMAGGAARQKMFGKCLCFGNRTFEQRFERAYTVVKAQVIREWTSCKYCRIWNDDQYKIHVYVIQILYQMKGPKMSEYSRIQGFSFWDLCGRRLRNAEYYLLMLPDPGRTSPGSFWLNSKKWPQVSQCEIDRFSDLTIKQVEFITTMRWLWNFFEHLREFSITPNIS